MLGQDSVWEGQHISKACKHKNLRWQAEKHFPRFINATICSILGHKKFSTMNRPQATVLHATFSAASSLDSRGTASSRPVNPKTVGRARLAPRRSDSRSPIFLLSALPSPSRQKVRHGVITKPLHYVTDQLTSRIVSLGRD